MSINWAHDIDCECQHCYQRHEPEHVYRPQSRAADAVAHPAHYCYGPYECLDVIVGQKFGFLAGQVIKYVWRHAHKERPLEDLRKARFYLERLIAETEKETTKSE